VVVHEMDFFYSGSDGGELRASDLAGLDAGVRRTVIKKELLRRAVISAGVKEGIYADDEAVAYLLPRVERLLEDYYYYRKADFHGIQRSTVLNTPDNASLQEFARTNPIVKSAGADVKMLAAERDRMARRITEKRFTEARGRVIQEFLASHPRLEVSE
ncbi:MAG: hypothetical protein HY042_07870, partial [Spirochaetia bacterium]|nr:hypothetical protein [Spirochaetia bacterium]